MNYVGSCDGGFFLVRRKDLLIPVNRHKQDMSVFDALRYLTVSQTISLGDL
jgi:hypothetical protein